MFLRFAWLVVLALAACADSKRLYREAVEDHRQAISMAAAMEPLILAGARLDTPAADRLRAAAARASLMRLASQSARHRPAQAAAKTPSERLGLAFSALRLRCVILPNEDRNSGQRAARACADALRTLDQALSQEDEAAVKHGLSAGTIPRVLPQFVTALGQSEADALVARFAPGPQELIRRKRWSDAQSTDEDLSEACMNALIEMRDRPRELYQDVRNTCDMLRSAKKELKRGQECAGEPAIVCANQSYCQILAAMGKNPAVPQSYAQRLSTAAQNCEKNYQAVAAKLAPAKLAQARHK